MDLTRFGNKLFNCGQNALSKGIRTEWDSNPRPADYESRARTTAPTNNNNNNPYSPLLIYFTQINGGGGHVSLAMPVTVVMPGFVYEGLKRGSEATERGEGMQVWEGGHLPR